MLNNNIENSKSMTVKKSDTALAVGSGKVEVLATPVMITLVEECCAESVEELIGDENTSVGTNIYAEHISPSVEGMTIICKSNLNQIDGKRLLFSFEVYDDCGLIGKGTHERFIVNKERFVSKAISKSNYGV